MRTSRSPHHIRPVTFETNVSPYAEGSCLISVGATKVLCTASVEGRVPFFCRGKKHGWLTAEYGMLPRSTDQRISRDKVMKGGRTKEIQRLIGRSLRSTLNLKRLGERQITVDCDVLCADGGTRTASVTGGYVAMALALRSLVEKGTLKESPLISDVAAISCGVVEGQVLVDLDYAEDSKASADANFVLTNAGGLVEVQATAEGDPFQESHLLAMLALAREATQTLAEEQKKALL